MMIEDVIQASAPRINDSIRMQSVSSYVLKHVFANIAQHCVDGEYTDIHMPLFDITFEYDFPEVIDQAAAEAFYRAASDYYIHKLDTLLYALLASGTHVINHSGGEITAATIQALKTQVEKNGVVARSIIVPEHFDCTEDMGTYTTPGGSTGVQLMGLSVFAAHPVAPTPNVFVLAAPEFLGAQYGGGFDWKVEGRHVTLTRSQALCVFNHRSVTFTTYKEDCYADQGHA